MTNLKKVFCLCRAAVEDLQDNNGEGLLLDRYYTITFNAYIITTDSFTAH